MEKEEKIKDIINRSGNDLHLRTVSLLESLGWDVNVGPYYNDPITGKPREIDIVAIKKYELGRNNCLAVRLFIECKYISDLNILWFLSKDIEQATKLAKNNSIFNGLDDNCLQNNSFIPNKKHHYLQDDDVVKLADKSGNYDPFYEGMNGCLNAMIYYKENQHLDASHTVDFPIILVDSFQNVHKRSECNMPGTSEISNNFQREIDYSYRDKKGNNISRYFLLDVVSFDKLAVFLDFLEKNDVSLMREQLAWEQRRRSINRLREGSESFDPYE